MLECPKCRTNEYTNTALIMLINECGHPLCKNCVDNIFVHNVAQCPQEGCARPLKKSTYWQQTFDDPRIEREVFVRKRLSKIYNMQEDDFSSLKEFNDYLEHVEELVQRLLDENDTSEVEEEIGRYREENRETIDKNKKRLTSDDIWVQKMIEEEAHGAQRMLDEHIDENITDINKAVTIDPKSIIKELRDSDLPAEILLDQKRKQQAEAELALRREAEQKKLEKQEQQKRRHVTDRKAFGVLCVSGQPYHHTVSTITYNGPRMPSDDEINEKYTPMLPVSEQSLAGGFTAHLACYRRLLDARIDLFSLI